MATDSAQQSTADPTSGGTAIGEGQASSSGQQQGNNLATGIVKPLVHAMTLAQLLIPLLVPLDKDSKQHMQLFPDSPEHQMEDLSTNVDWMRAILIRVSTTSFGTTSSSH